MSGSGKDRSQDLFGCILEDESEDSCRDDDGTDHVLEKFHAIQYPDG